MLEELLKVFGLETKRDDLIMRVSDLSKTVTGSLNELNNLAVMTDVINKKQLEEVFRDVQVNTKVLVDASKAAERASKSLEVMQVVISASMAFDLIDRFTGFNQGIDTEGVPWMDFITQNLIYPPGVWFGFNARPSPIPSPCTQFARTGIEWRRCHRAACMARSYQEHHRSVRAEL